MSANLRIYEDYLYYLPEKERKAAEEALFLKDEQKEGRTESLIKQLNRRRVETEVRE